MKKIESSSELRKIELAILGDFASYCEQHNLRYFLSGGTLIGVIRHKGFIPWDDDIDVIMPRPDFMYFVNNYNNRDSFYKVNSVFNIGHWYSTFAEVEDTRTLKIYNGFDIKQKVGISIDIFPLDGAPDNYLVRRCFWLLLNVTARIATLSAQKFTISHHFEDQSAKLKKVRIGMRTLCKFATIPIAKLFSPINLNLLVNKLAMNFDVDNSKFVGVSVFPHYGYKECIHKNNFLASKKRLFEGKFYNTPMHYDEYLSHLYGDYMKMPPKTVQKSHHDFEAFKLN